MAASGGAPRYHIIREAELDHARQSGHRLRAYCPVHGSDHQRSLDIECEGDAAGWGICRSCSARVFVPELATPEAAARILAGDRSGPRPQARPRTAQDIKRDILRRAQRRATPAEPAPVATITPELAELRALDGRMRLRLEDERARAYLAARCIPLEVAQAYGVGYIPADARLAGDLARWRDRLMFPLGTPASAGMAGPGYIGRSLWGWTPEATLDEDAHKALLDSTPGAPPRWLKTQAPAGMFNYVALEGAETAVIVEGGVDALALITGGVGAPVVALAGTAARVDWIPASVRGVVLALDEDKPEARDAAAKLADDLRYKGVRVERIAPPSDGPERALGKDWAARWRATQGDALAAFRPVYDALARLDSALDGDASPLALNGKQYGQSSTVAVIVDALLAPSIAPASAQHRPASASRAAPDAPSVTPAVEDAPAPAAELDDAQTDAQTALADLWALARADPVVSLLEGRGYVLADVWARSAGAAQASIEFPAAGTVCFS